MKDLLPAVSLPAGERHFKHFRTRKEQQGLCGSAQALSNRGRRHSSRTVPACDLAVV